MSTPAAPRGFTLLELLVVIGVLSVLMGLSLGYLGKVDPHLIADSVLAGERRSAQLTARAEGVPTEVVMKPGVGNEAATVQSRLLQPVLTWHFEPNQDYLDNVLRPSIGGSDVKNGRFGHARQPLEGDRNPLLHWEATPSLFDVREGFVVRLDLWCDRRGQAVLLRFLPTLEVTVDDQLRPRARIKVHQQGSEGAVSIGVGSELSLPLHRWCTLDIACDGSHAWMTLDGRELGSVVSDGGPQQEPSQAFDLSPSEGPWPGAIDEVRLFVFSFSPAQTLPVQLQPAATYHFAYDAQGEATTEPTVRYLEPQEQG